MDNPSTSVSTAAPPNVYLIPTTSISFNLITLPSPPIYDPPPRTQSPPESLVIHHFPTSQFPTMEQHLGGMSDQELDFFGDHFTDSIWVYSSDEQDTFLDIAEGIAERDYAHYPDLLPPELYAEQEIDFNAAQNMDQPPILPFQYDDEPIFDLNNYYDTKLLAAQNNACLQIRQHFDQIITQCRLRQEQISSYMDATFDMHTHLNIDPFL